MDVTGFTKDSEKEAYFQTITGKQEDYDNAQKDVDAILSAMKDRKSASIAARGNMDIEGKTLLNSAGALLYSGGNMDISEKESVTTGAQIWKAGETSPFLRHIWSMKTKPFPPSGTGQAM